LETEFKDNNDVKSVDNQNNCDNVIVYDILGKLDNIQKQPCHYSDNFSHSDKVFEKLSVPIDVGEGNIITPFGSTLDKTVTDGDNKSENVRKISTSDVKMRAPLREYSSKRTASYRWSGTEMFQLEGKSAVHNVTSTDQEVIPTLNKDNNIDRLDTTRVNIAYKKTNAGLEKRLNKLGFSCSSTYTEKHKDGDNCLKALIDQMSLPGQDFKVWDKDDHCFLRWYIAKQLEIQIGNGNSGKVVEPSVQSLPEFMETVKTDEKFVDNRFLYSTAKIFNKDIIIISSGSTESSDSDNVKLIDGGKDGGKGKGQPLYLAHLRKEDAGENYYQSITPNENSNLEYLSALLHHT